MSRMHAIVDAAAHLVPAVAPRPAREPGTGYGTSSSYGAPRSYVTNTSPSRFRIA
ncbi:hypothetical protein LU699_09240 [Luteimonas fraxinea]|uniref:Uncharacterized protein n=1 Tax=Luteimonas fraxinea TaxID=2901869 RepID=A0ABS8UDQ8_9GAMM|nr:hypothetical protein [Luteimonas fraxinea]MCD9097617.1 hypothetical protein [Luteimonas fraxinea]UHH08516.1 hypothetical protein LU699_09240 [Luteimonas fraxinea]